MWSPRRWEPRTHLLRAFTKVSITICRLQQKRRRGRRLWKNVISRTFWYQAVGFLMATQQGSFPPVEQMCQKTALWLRRKFTNNALWPTQHLNRFQYITIGLTLVTTGYFPSTDPSPDVFGLDIFRTNPPPDRFRTWATWQAPGMPVTAGRPGSLVLTLEYFEKKYCGGWSSSESGFLCQLCQTKSRGWGFLC